MSTIYTTQTAPAGVNGVPALLQLQNGDHLSREEFERRYEAMPGIKQAELIEGVVHMPSPVKFKKHSQPQFHLIGCWQRMALRPQGLAEATMAR